MWCVSPHSHTHSHTLTHKHTHARIHGRHKLPRVPLFGQWMSKFRLEHKRRQTLVRTYTALHCVCPFAPENGAHPLHVIVSIHFMIFDIFHPKRRTHLRQQHGPIDLTRVCSAAAQRPAAVAHQLSLKLKNLKNLNMSLSLTLEGWYHP